MASELEIVFEWCWKVYFRNSFEYSKNRYVFLAASSSFKGKSDMNKYEKVWNEIRVYCIGKNAKEIYHQNSPRNKEEYEIIGSTIEVWIGKCRDKEGIDNVQPLCG